MSSKRSMFTCLARQAQSHLASRPNARRLPPLIAQTSRLQRPFSTTRLRLYDHQPATLSDRRYYQLADATLTHLLHELEREADENDLLEDVEYSEGVMNVAVAERGTYVLNRQPPSKQVWLSSPISGPKRFDYVEGEGWVYRDGTKLKALLEEEWTEAGLKLDLTRLGLMDV